MATKFVKTYNEEINAYINIGFEDKKQFCKQITYLNSLGKPYAYYEEIDIHGGGKEICYRRINSEGKHSLEAFDSLITCLKYPGERIN